MKKKELEALKITELRSFAHKNGVPLRRTWSKAEIVTAILRMTSPKRGRKPKPVVKVKASGLKKKQKKAKLKTSPKKLKTGVLKKTSATAVKAASTPKKAPLRRVTTPTLLKDRITLMVRDAGTLFAYWSISSPGAKQPDTIQGEYLNLRLCDLSAKGNTDAAKDYYDIPVTDRVGNRYIEMRLPGHRFICEIGIITNEGEFLVLAKSKEVETPPDRLEAFPSEAESFYRDTFDLFPGEALLLEDIYRTFVTSR